MRWETQCFNKGVRQILYEGREERILKKPHTTKKIHQPYKARVNADRLVWILYISHTGLVALEKQEIIQPAYIAIGTFAKTIGLSSASQIQILESPSISNAGFIAQLSNNKKLSSDLATRFHALTMLNSTKKAKKRPLIPRRKKEVRQILYEERGFKKPPLSSPKKP